MTWLGTWQRDGKRPAPQRKWVNNWTTAGKSANLKNAIVLPLRNTQRKVSFVVRNFEYNSETAEVTCNLTFCSRSTGVCRLHAVKWRAIVGLPASPHIATQIISFCAFVGYVCCWWQKVSGLLYYNASFNMFFLSCVPEFFSYWSFWSQTQVAQSASD